MSELLGEPQTGGSSSLVQLGRPLERRTGVDAADCITGEESRCPTAPASEIVWRHLHPPSSSAPCHSRRGEHLILFMTQKNLHEKIKITSQMLFFTNLNLDTFVKVLFRSVSAADQHSSIAGGRRNENQRQLHTMGLESMLDGRAKCAVVCVGIPGATKAAVSRHEEVGYEGG